MLAFIVVLMLLPMIFLLLGIKWVPVGAVGVVIFIGRRTNDVRQEGITWVVPFLSKLEWIYPRERQVDILKVPYYTADRVRISFKTTLRVAVTNAAALLEQGPGTYGPFTQDAKDAEETNIALRGLMQNAIRETVQSMRIDQILFGGNSEFQPALRERIRAGGSTRRHSAGAWAWWRSG